MFERIIEKLKDGTEVPTSINADATTSSQTIAKPIVSGRCYQIDFGNHLRCQIKVTDVGVEVEGAINGWGDDVPLNEVVIAELQ